MCGFGLLCIPTMVWPCIEDRRWGRRGTGRMDTPETIPLQNASLTSSDLAAWVPCVPGNEEDLGRGAARGGGAETTHPAGKCFSPQKISWGVPFLTE